MASCRPTTSLPDIAISKDAQGCVWPSRREVEPVEQGRQINVRPLEPGEVDIKQRERRSAREVGQDLGLHGGVVARFACGIVDGREVLRRRKDAVRPAVPVDGVPAALGRLPDLFGLVVLPLAVGLHEVLADGTDQRLLVLRADVARTLDGVGVHVRGPVYPVAITVTANPLQSGPSRGMIVDQHHIAGRAQ
jgi:hypothetical protein